ncbi:acyl-CoA thioesterase [Nocardia neocaledoniensis NBRC 108232]|uniref:Thioesterase superfamily protein n=1 Tax=Nocardia neocaledoniensis TaxID=236511 RepID=A0A317N3W1_9NOCA|nr:acyl-CoA thioesterase domain-containing protein [Nocardia neocaledoniensis]PWV68987.1 thioesterase superfamily protein [Nocardia neocaledoniensis]GEM29626.1 acyl-CoA thioesterase [Nocardia neocaledoniensis NBRC 108232]
MTTAFFRTRTGPAGIELIPQAEASSGWGDEHMRGLAVSSALARATEQHVESIGRGDLTPARWTVDLFRPARLRPCTTSVTVVREGRRLCLIDSVLEQGGRPVARASALWLAPSRSPSGAVWSGGAQPELPPVGAAMVPAQHRLYFTEKTGWGDAAQSKNDARKQIWHEQIPVVEGEPVTPFQLAAGIADVVNVAANFGSAGLEFINADLTLALARLPEGPAVGFATTDRIERAGISIGTAVAFDRTGVFGTATLCALADGQRAVDVASFRPMA